jgi:hypothetical protein
MMQKPPTTIQDRIDEHTDENGDVICLKCESDILKDETRDVLVGNLTEKPKLVPLSTLFCDNCDYILLDDQEVIEIRKYLSK